MFLEGEKTAQLRSKTASSSTSVLVVTTRSLRSLRGHYAVTTVTTWSLRSLRGHYGHYRGGHLSFPTFLMSFAASHSGCQASTKIGATPAHTGKVHTQVVSCLCFVSTERTRQASCCTSGRRELNFALTWIAFVWVQNVARKVATVARFRCGRSIFLGF